MAAKPCNSCPLAWTDESERVQNYGCLPSGYDIIRMKEETGNNWACHSNCNRVCQGLIAINEELKLGFDMNSGELIRDFESVHSLT